METYELHPALAEAKRALQVARAALDATTADTPEYDAALDAVAVAVRVHAEARRAARRAA